MKKDYFWGFMCAFVLAFTLVCITHCESKSVKPLQIFSGEVVEKDSMRSCIREFDEIFSLADTVCEDEDGETAIDSFESYMSRDTVDIDVARSLYQAVAKEIEFVVHLQLDSDEDSDAAIFDGRWHEFNKRYINLKQRISLREQLNCYVICYHHGEQFSFELLIRISVHNQNNNFFIKMLFRAYRL